MTPAALKSRSFAPDVVIISLIVRQSKLTPKIKELLKK
jgi:hypothetical protein